MELKFGKTHRKCGFPVLQQLFIFLLVNLSLPLVYSQSIIINEVSQGTSGNQEYVEFLVTGPNLVNCTDTPPCLDLRGYIFDDNNGYLNGAPTSGVGIASGACRFSQDPLWACVPAGTLIVIYNDADLNGSIPAQDLSTSDGNCLLNVPISSALFERHTTLPSASNGNYPTTGWISGGNWTQISMANTADGFQIYAPSNTTVPVFSIGWGSANNLGDIYMGSSSAGGKVFYSSDCNYFTQASWINGNASSDQTPGFLNSGQASCAGLMNANCDPPTVVITPTAESCTGLCDGLADAVVSGGLAPYQFSWSPLPGGGQGTANASSLCPGNYTLTITNDNGNGCILTETVTIVAGTSSATPTFNAVAPVCAGDALGPFPTTSLNGFSGTWSPAPDNTATTTYTFTPSAGQCAGNANMTVTVNNPATPVFNSINPICSGDALTPLPTTSTNGINGTWSPALDNTATTTYTFTPSTGQCASNQSLTISVNPIFTGTQAVTLCPGSDFTYPDGFTSFNIQADESHLAVLTSVNGCDSSVTVNVTLVSSVSSSENINICSGDNYTFPDGTTHIAIAANESYSSTLISVAGCDSVVTTNLIVNPGYAFNENVTLCENENFTFPDGSAQVITGNLTHVSTLNTVQGCDSIITTNITMTPAFNSAESVTVCENTTYFFPDGSSQVITVPVTHVSAFVSVGGCDSLITTTVLVNPAYHLSENVIICEGSNYTFRDGIVHTGISTNEFYTASFTTVAGCDSIWETTITVEPNPAVSAGPDVVVCSGDPVTLSGSGAQTYTWTGGVSNGVPFTPSGAQNYTVTGTDAFGCTATDDVSVSVSPGITPMFSADIVSGCAPLTVLFENLSSGSANCEWQTGDGTVLTGCGSQAYTYTSSGLYDVSLTVTDVAGCVYSTTTSDYVEVLQSPEASFFASRYVLDEQNNQVAFTNQSSGASWYTWSFGDGSGWSTQEEPVHQYLTNESNVHYTVTLIAGNGSDCVDSAQAVIAVQDVLIFYVPNAFTPDGDAFNETFCPVFVSGFDPYDFHLAIFNRWGELVFESYNAAVGWSGTYGDQGLVKDDVYVWKIDFKESMSDKRQEFYGHVTVLK